MVAVVTEYTTPCDCLILFLLVSPVFTSLIRGSLFIIPAPIQCSRSDPYDVLPFLVPVVFDDILVLSSHVVSPACRFMWYSGCLVCFRAFLCLGPPLITNPDSA